MATKPVLPLDERFHLGVPEIDAQHKELTELVEKFKAAVAGKDQRHLIHPVLRRLYHLLSQHFAYEEKLMEMVSYADLPQHRKTHKGILKLLNDYFERPIEPGDFEHFGKLIGDRVLAHVMEHDVKMTATIREQLPSLPSAAEAAALD